MEIGISLLLLENFKTGLIPPCLSQTYVSSIFNKEFYIPLKEIFFFAIFFFPPFASFSSILPVPFFYLHFFPFLLSFFPLLFCTCMQKGALSYFFIR